ncbi:hypothetical protein LSCM1_00857 [Leishmania martiniquensis]|uniref:C3H1-type domain-containing protein n=1 Tax=Leishmania martiniquensis TaxID=1580590 RepID=A0A836KBY9_9TRYP|nr:hypothetical protein LSCM1_00857 [Leishmania martiniquensis]
MTSQSHVTMSKHNGSAVEQHKRTSHTSGDTNEEEKHILAGRYKTKLCKNYVAKGECPYDVRCMFAHGEEELRTSDDNVRDGLITEEAIKDFQRQQNQAKRRAAFAAAREHNHDRSHSHTVCVASHRSAYETEENVENNEAYRGRHPHQNLRQRPQQESVSIAQQQQQQQFQLQGAMTQCYTHNPYALDLIPPAARLFPVYHEVVEEGCWYEQELAPPQEDYYFPSSDMMLPLVPSSVTQKCSQYPHQQCSKQFETVTSSSSYSGEEVMYGHGESSASAAYRSMARCTAAELPSNSDIPAMVMEP